MNEEEEGSTALGPYLQPRAVTAHYRAVIGAASGIVCAQWHTWHEDSGGRAGHRIGCRRQTVGRCGYWSAKRRKRETSADVGRVVESTRVL